MDALRTHQDVARKLPQIPLSFAQDIRRDKVYFFNDYKNLIGFPQALLKPTNNTISKKES